MSDTSRPPSSETPSTPSMPSTTLSPLASSRSVPDVENPLEAVNFLIRFSAMAPDSGTLRRLHVLLMRMDGTLSLGDIADWLEDISAWLRGGLGLASRDVRMKLLMDVLEQTPTCAKKINEALIRLFAESSAVRLFSDTGLPTEHGFFSETINRVSLKVLPEAPAPEDLAQLLWRMFPHAQDASWIESLPETTWSRLTHLLPALRVSVLTVRLIPHVREAALLVALRVGALGLSDDIRARSDQTQLTASPFFELRHTVEALLLASDVEDSPTAKPAWVRARETIAACRRTVHAVVANLETSGVSVDMVYRLERIVKGLDRLYTLLALLAPSDGVAVVTLRHKFFLSLIRGAARDRSLSELVSRSSRQLARKVIERAGTTGEHYITSTRAEYHEMVDSAGGGGVLTAFTAMFKFLVAGAKLPHFFEGFFLSMNYAVSFVGIQLLGFTLATKQPSMTAAALAGSIREMTAEEEPDLNPLLDQIARITRSQLAAIAGNIGIVIPSCILVDIVFRLLTGHSYLAPETAEYVVHSLNPFHSLTIFYAALTGVLLWASSILSGTLDNWTVYRKLTEGIGAMRSLRWAFGKERAAAFGELLKKHMAGFGGNVSLGILLGMTPAFGKFFGLPLDVRHVTLSMAQLTYAGASIGPYEFFRGPFWISLFGILIIAAFNFGVSFSLALSVALRARDVGARGQFRLGRALLERFLKEPWIFIFPPKEEGLTKNAHE